MNTVSMGLIDVPALVQVMTWHQTGDKALSKPMLAMFIVYMRHPSSMHWHEQRTCWWWHWHKSTTSGYSHCTQLKIIVYTMEISVIVIIWRNGVEYFASMAKWLVDDAKNKDLHNLLSPRDAIWQHKVLSILSTLTQVMAWDYRTLTSFVVEF